MKRKQLSRISIILLAAFAGFLLFRDYRQSWRMGNDIVGKAIFPDLPVNAAHKIIISAAGQETILERRDQRWRVMNLYGYPADFERLAPLVRSLPELTAVKSFVVAPNDYARLQLNDPATHDRSDAGLKLEVLDADNRSLATIILGQTFLNDEQVAIGRYVLLPRQNSVVLVTDPFSQLDAVPRHWLDRSFPRLEKLAQARKIVKGTPVWTLNRSQAGRALLDGNIPDGRLIDPDRLERTQTILNRMNFTNIGDPSKNDSEWGFEDTVFELSGHEGIRYRFILGNLTERRELPVRIEVEFDEPHADTDAIPNTEAIADDVIRAARERSQRESEQFRNWVYLMPRASYEPMLYSINDFLLPAP